MLINLSSKIKRGSIVNENKIIKHDVLIYMLNEEEKICGIIGTINNVSGNIFIPLMIKHETEEFIITSIEKRAFHDLTQIESIQFPSNSKIQIIKEEAFSNSSISKILIPSHVIKICDYAFCHCSKLQQVEFSPDSQIQIIGKNAFSFTSIKSISIPSSVIELQEGWCSGSIDLKKIEIIPQKEKNISFYDDKFIIGKSDVKSDEYDVLLWASRDIKKITIPSFIKKIDSYSFHLSEIEEVFISTNVTEICEGAFLRCQNLHKVEFSSDSKLQIIGEQAFLSTSINKISIPQHVIKICRYAFNNCHQLKTVEFSKNSELQIIEEKAFFHSSLTNISIPSNFSGFQEVLFLGTELAKVTIIPNKEKNISYYEDNCIIGKSDTKSGQYDVLLFVPRNMKEFTIPPFIKKIGKYAFADSLIEKIIISPHITQICKGAFDNCRNLQHVEIPKESKLRVIEESSFDSCSIESICIPPHVTQISQYAFNCCYQLKKIEISPDSELRTIEKEAFISSSVENISIPSNIVDLQEGWCSETNLLTKVTIIPKKEKNISLYENKFVIGKSDIKSEKYDVLLFVPRDTKYMEIPKFITIIGSFAFSKSLIEKIFIHSQITKICSGAFYFCDKLRYVEIPNDSELQIIEKNAFCLSKINSFYIPSKVTNFSEKTFENCFELSIIEIDENTEINSIDKYQFYYCQHSIFMIPSKFRYIFD